MFRNISYKIAGQFTAFVFLLLLLNGAIFLTVDVLNAKNQMHLRMNRTSHFVLRHKDPMDFRRSLPPDMRARVRVIDASGNILYTSPFFDDIPLPKGEGTENVASNDQEYVVLTTLISGGEVQGYVQVADVERQKFVDIGMRALLYLVVSIAISLLTFIVGLFFARRSLKPAERMVKQLEQFTQDASHELRTPLAVAISSLDIALKTREYKEGILSAKDDLMRINKLVDKLLELARMDTFAMQPNSVNISEIAQKAVEELQAAAQEKNVHLLSEIAENARVRGDATLLLQLMRNLLSNALKFTEAGGTVTLTLTRHLLQVSDTGIGIGSKDVPFVFDRFYRADAARDGSGFGLGLSLVKRIADLHGWRVSIKSKEGAGTTVTVKFSSHPEA